MSSVHGLKINLAIATQEVNFMYLVVVCHSYVNPLLPVVRASVFHTVRLKPCCNRMLPFLIQLI